MLFPKLPLSTLLLALVFAPAGAAFAAEPAACLSKDAQRSAVASGQSVTLARAIHAIRPKTKGDVVRAQLCRGSNGLVYVLTVLSRSGKVTRATIDAANGNVIGGG